MKMKQDANTHLSISVSLVRALLCYNQLNSVSENTLLLVVMLSFKHSFTKSMPRPKP